MIVEAVNVGVPMLSFGDVVVETAIWKAPASGRRRVHRRERRGRPARPTCRVHGGPDKAALALVGREQGLVGGAPRARRAARLGMFGENLSTSGVEVDEAVVGELWRVGSALLRGPASHGCPPTSWASGSTTRAMPRRFAAAGRPGAYLRACSRRGRSAPATTSPWTPARRTGSRSGTSPRAYHAHDASLAAPLLDVPELDDGWKAWARRRVDRHRG